MEKNMLIFDGQCSSSEGFYIVHPMSLYLLPAAVRAKQGLPAHSLPKAISADCLLPHHDVLKAFLGLRVPRTRCTLFTLNMLFGF